MIHATSRPDTPTTRIRFFDPILRHDPDITAAWHWTSARDLRAGNVSGNDQRPLLSDGCSCQTHRQHTCATSPLRRRKCTRRITSEKRINALRWPSIVSSIEPVEASTDAMFWRQNRAVIDVRVHDFPMTFLLSALVNHLRRLRSVSKAQICPVFPPAGVLFRKLESRGSSRYI